ncbi:MAG TPA: sugar phosphate isomerase/epimerase family protein [Deltaproteobacteria bacterium]|nr:sugar phosphate isomerase/epimerase family protein [Deltaproteobacteria bacterium]
MIETVEGCSDRLSERLHATVPCLRLSAYLELLVERRINPEIYFSAEALECCDHSVLKQQAALLREAGLSVTLHAPHMDLNPGSLDPYIRNATARRFEELFRAAELLCPKVMVFHPGYDELRYGDYRQAWLDNSIAFWRPMVARASGVGTVIAVENIFDKEPSVLAELLEAIGDPCFCHCFDAGHWHMFNTVSMEAWFERLGHFVAEAHIHDNHGVRDEHLPPGEGTIDFRLLFSLLEQHAPQAVWTLEAHTQERLERALVSVRNYL